MAVGTTPFLNDLAPSTEHFDPQFAWDMVPGAARYEVEVNSDSNFDPASKVCCTDKPVSTTLTPLEVFANNTYYWRVRAIDRGGNAGVWNEGPSFDKTFDNYPDPQRGLDQEPPHARRERSGHRSGAGSDGYQTDTPILTWDPVPALRATRSTSSRSKRQRQPRDVQLDGFKQPRWTVPTSSTSWTPLGNASTTLPFSSGFSRLQRHPARSRPVSPTAHGCGHVAVASTCPRPSGATTRSSATGPPNRPSPSGAPAGDVCSPDCNPGYLGADDYLGPFRTETIGANPLFTWKPIAGMNSYWVIVAKDPSFTTIIDYAITHVPAYAVRTRTAPLPTPTRRLRTTGSFFPPPASTGAAPRGIRRSARTRTSRSRPLRPRCSPPTTQRASPGQPTFEWSSIYGARRYRVQVDDEITFSAPLLDDTRTASTAYTSLKTYESAQTYYWRVAPEDEQNRGLTWSDYRSFQISLPAPVLDMADFGTAEAPPVISWSSVPGAVSYTLDVQESDGDHTQFAGFPSTASSWQKFTGVGIMTLKVRAEFPTASTFTTVSGPWSATSTFTHVIQEPQNPTSDAGQNRLLLHWDAKTGMKNYKVQISAGRISRPSSSRRSPTTRASRRR